MVAGAARGVGMLGAFYVAAGKPASFVILPNVMYEKKTRKYTGIRGKRGGGRGGAVSWTDEYGVLRRSRNIPTSLRY